MTVTLQSSPFLRIQRKFPFEDVKTLSSQVDHAYIDIATKVNARTIGLFALNLQVQTGETWNLSGSSTEQKSLRKVFTFTTTASIPHGIDLTTVSYFTNNYGQYLDVNGDWSGLISGSSSATTIPGQISFFVDPNNIVFRVDAAAPTPIVKGVLVLQWISQF